MSIRLRRSEAPAYLWEKHRIKVATSTLAKLFTVGGGPAVQHFGKIPLYTPEALDAWVAQKLSAPRRSSSEARRTSAQASAT